MCHNNNIILFENVDDISLHTVSLFQVFICVIHFILFTCFNSFDPDVLNRFFFNKINILFIMKFYSQ